MEYNTIKTKKDTKDKIPFENMRKIIKSCKVQLEKMLKKC